MKIQDVKEFLLESRRRSSDMQSLPSQPEKILIRSTNWIGDAVMTTPAIRSIRRHFPRACITLLAQPWVADVFQACPHIDRIILYEKQGKHQGIKGLLRLSASLRTEGYDLALLLQNAFEAALISLLARIPVRAGYASDARGLLLTHGIPQPQKPYSKHHVHYYQELLQGLGIQTAENRLELFIDSAELRRVDPLLAETFSRQQKPLIGLNPGAAYGPAKRWPKEKYAALAEQLLASTGGNLLVFGTAADQEAGTLIAAAAPDRVLDLTGKTHLAFALACISRCQVFVTNDSGLMHVAAALNIPLVVLFGSTDAVATGPFSERATVIRKPLSCSPCLKSHCPQGHFQCMEQIAVEEVAHAVLCHLMR
jgi:heptosyltransferase II